MDPIDPAIIPPGVRNAGPQAEKLYGAALQFESLLTSQITQQMFDATNSMSSDDPDNPDASNSGPYDSMLPGALNDSITHDGGLGLATSLYQSFGGVLAPAPSQPQPTSEGDS
jgi:Rod binding domain-containing protein